MADSQERYKEMNRMLIFSFLEIFMSEPFRESFPDNPPPRLTVLEWITESDLPSAKRIVARLKQKTAYEMLRSLVGSEMCIRDSFNNVTGEEERLSCVMTDEEELLSCVKDRMDPSKYYM